jgi:hypothetical protein
LLFDLALALLGACLGIGEDALGLLVSSVADLFSLAPRLGEQRLTIRFGLLGRASRLIGVLHAVADALRASVQHADNRLEQELTQQQEQDDEIDRVPEQPWNVQAEGTGD